MQPKGLFIQKNPHEPAHRKRKNVDQQQAAFRLPCAALLESSPKGCLPIKTYTSRYTENVNFIRLTWKLNASKTE
jgi:hypothetical protein